MLSREEIYRVVKSLETKPQATDELKGLLDKPISEDKINTLNRELAKYANHSVDMVWKIEELGRDYLTKYEHYQFQKAVVSNSKKQTKINEKQLKFNKLALVVMVISVAIAFYAVTLQEQKPDLRLYTDTASNEVNNSFTLFVHNQGEEPCFNLKLQIPESIAVRQYLNPDLYRKKFEAADNYSIQFAMSPLFLRWADSKMGDYNEYFIEFIKPDEFIPYRLTITDTRIKSFWIKAKCAQSSQKLQLTLLV